MSQIPFPGGAADQDVFFHEDKVCVYHKAINTWECRTISTGGSDAGQPAAVTTQTVYTIPISTTNGSVNKSGKIITDLRTQYDVNWFIAENIEELKKDVAFLSQQVSGLSKIFVGEDKPNNDYNQWSFWYNPVTGEFFYWDVDQDNWLLVNASRPPIFSDTEPTEHPNFQPPESELIQGDVWIDITDPDELIQYIYDGNDWIKTGGDYVHRKGGDIMEGPLQITGNRSPNADGIESTLKVLNVDSGQSSTLNLKWDNNTKVYVGEKDVTLVNDLKFNTGGKAIYAQGPDKKGFVVNDSGVFYDGNYTVDRHVATKKNVEEAIFNDILDKDNTNKYVDRTGDSMSGQLEMKGSRLVFNNIPDGGQVIRANRSAGNDVDLLYLAHSGGAVQGYYDVRMTGNTSYNGIRFKGGSGGDAPIFEMRANGNYNIFYSDLRFDGNRIIDLGNAVEDTDAVTYGQVKQELAEFRDSVIQELSFGTWSYSSNQITPFQTRFYVRGSNGATSNVSAALVDTLVFNVEDLYGNIGAFDRVDVGELFTLSREGIVLKYRVTTAPTISGSQNDGRVIGVNFVSQSQSVTFTEGQVWNVQLTEFKDISVDQLDDTYLRLDTSNDPLENTLKIHSTGFGEAKLTLQGKRDNANNTCATIEFNNEQVSDDAKTGYLTYYNYGSTQRFGFNQDVELGGNTLKGAGGVQIYNGGSIDAGTTKRILLQNPTQGGEGGDFGAVSIRRAIDWRRSFAIRGNVNGSEDDIFYANTTADGTDGVLYKGHTDFEYNILNRKALTEALANFNPNTILEHTPYISNQGGTNSGVTSTDVGQRGVAGFYTSSSSYGSINQYPGNFNSYLKCGSKVIATQTGDNDYLDLPIGHDLEFSGIVTVLNRDTGGVLYKNTVTRVQCAQDSGAPHPHVKIWVRDFIGSPKGRKPMFGVGNVNNWYNVCIMIEGYYLN